METKTTQRVLRLLDRLQELRQEVAELQRDLTGDPQREELRGNVIDAALLLLDAQAALAGESVEEV